MSVADVRFGCRGQQCEGVDFLHGTLRLRLAKLTRHDLDHVTALIKTRLKRMQNPHDLSGGLVAKTGLARSLRNPSR
jgi:hypothetical protein